MWYGSVLCRVSGTTPGYGSHCHDFRRPHSQRTRTASQDFPEDFSCKSCATTKQGNAGQRNQAAEIMQLFEIHRPCAQRAKEGGPCGGVRIERAWMGMLLVWSTQGNLQSKLAMQSSCKWRCSCNSSRLPCCTRTTGVLGRP